MIIWKVSSTNSTWRIQCVRQCDASADYILLRTPRELMVSSTDRDNDDRNDKRLALRDAGFKTYNSDAKHDNQIVSNLAAGGAGEILVRKRSVGQGGNT